jgi:small-conductance mechanosensitive channel
MTNTIGTVRVAFEEFGTTSFNFTLYTFIDDITKAGKTRTDLSIAILDASVNGPHR